MAKKAKSYPDTAIGSFERLMDEMPPAKRANLYHDWVRVEMAMRWGAYAIDTVHKIAQCPAALDALDDDTQRAVKQVIDNNNVDAIV